MSPAKDLAARLALVRRVIALSPEPLHLPVGLVFRPLEGRAHLRAWEEHAERCARGAAFAPATLYVNVPFCARVCTFCLLSAVRAPGKDAVAAYVDALLRQIAMYEPVARGMRFHSLHVGGGTPTLLDEAQLDALFTALARFPRAEGFQIGVEAHPATATPGRLAVLARHGVHRLSFGVETLTPRVLAAVNRADQTEARVRAAVAEARRLGFAVNLDLLAGLPGEDDASWAATVEAALSLAPDSMSVNRFLGENSALARHGFGPDARENRRVDAMLLRADAIVRDKAPPRWPEAPIARAGFGSQYVWEREGARRYFQDDMIGPTSTLAFGHGALGHVYGRHFSVPAGSVDDYVASLARGEAPDALAAPVSERFEMAFFVAEHACRGDLTTASFARVFRRGMLAVFGDELRFLASRGLLARRGADGLAKVPDASFQVTHLLAFLLRDEAALAAQARALEGRRESDGDDGFLALSGDEGFEALERRVAQGAQVLKVDVGGGLDGDAATRLAALGGRRGLRVLVRGSERRETDQYASLDEELPPSMLWVRIAIRASQASRGEQRLAVKPPP